AGVCCAYSFSTQPVRFALSQRLDDAACPARWPALAPRHLLYAGANDLLPQSQDVPVESVFPTASGFPCSSGSPRTPGASGKGYGSWVLCTSLKDKLLEVLRWSCKHHHKQVG